MLVAVVLPESLITKGRQTLSSRSWCPAGAVGGRHGCRSLLPGRLAVARGVGMPGMSLLNHWSQGHIELHEIADIQPFLSFITAISSDSS